MPNIHLDLKFPHNYDIELMDELPSGNIKQIYFPGAVEEGGKSGIMVRIKPKKETSWIGIFASDYASPKALSGVFSCPDEQSVCIISSGQGFIVQVNEPKLYEEIQLHPITDVHLVFDKNLLLFVNFTKIAAYGAKGLEWVTDRLSWDGLEITEVTSKYVKGLAWDSPQNRKVEFLVDLQTGQYEGGSSPEMYTGR